MSNQDCWLSRRNSDNSGLGHQSGKCSRDEGGMRLLESQKGMAVKPRGYNTMSLEQTGINRPVMARSAAPTTPGLPASSQPLPTSSPSLEPRQYAAFVPSEDEGSFWDECYKNPAACLVSLPLMLAGCSTEPDLTCFKPYPMVPELSELDSATEYSFFVEGADGNDYQQVLRPVKFGGQLTGLELTIQDEPNVKYEVDIQSDVCGRISQITKKEYSLDGSLDSATSYSDRTTLATPPALKQLEPEMYDVMLKAYTILEQFDPKTATESEPVGGVIPDGQVVEGP